MNRPFESVLLKQHSTTGVNTQPSENTRLQAVRLPLSGARRARAKADHRLLPESVRDIERPEGPHKVDRVVAGQHTHSQLHACGRVHHHVALL